MPNPDITPPFSDFILGNISEGEYRVQHIKYIAQQKNLSEAYVSRNYEELLKQNELKWKYKNECNILTAPWQYKSYYLPSLGHNFAWICVIIFCVWKPLKYKNIGVKRLSIVLSPVLALACSLLFEELRIFGDDFIGAEGFFILAIILLGFPAALLTLIDIISISTRWVKNGFSKQK